MQKSTTPWAMLQIGGLLVLVGGAAVFGASPFTLLAVVLGLWMLVHGAIVARRIKQENEANSPEGKFHASRDAKEAALLAKQQAREKLRRQKSAEEQADARVADLDLK